VAQLLDAWLADAKGRLSPVTVAGYSHSIETYLPNRSAPSDCPGSAFEISTSCTDPSRRPGRSPYVIRQAHAAMRAALTQGWRWGWVSSNFATLARPSPIPKTPVKAPSTAQVRKLVTAAEKTDPQLATMTLIGALTGLRRGELCGLRWSDVDLVDGMMHVQRAWVIAAGKAHLKTPKTGDDRRVTLDELALATLSVLWELQKAAAAELGVELPDDGWLLSKDGMGFDPRNPDKMGRQVAAIAKDAGLKIHLHQLRHYGATELEAAGVPIRTIAGRLGHADPALTLRVYSHQVEERDREAAAILGRALTPKKAKPPCSPNN